MKNLFSLMIQLVMFAIIIAVLAAFVLWAARKLKGRNGTFALANAFPGQLGGRFPRGEKSFIIGAAVSLPVATRYLIYSYVTDQNHVQPTPDAATYPLGVSPDSPSGTIVGGVSQLTVYLFGVVPDTMIGIAQGAITHGNPVGTFAGGLVQDLTLAGNGNYWLIGYALNDTTANGAEVAIAHQPPRLVTITAGAISAVLK